MIKTITHICQQIAKAFSDLWNKSFSVRYVEDPVDNPKKRTLYVVGAADEPWQVEMICPCGCKDKIVLPVNDETSPRWNLSINGYNLPTLHPSVWRSKRCKAHFFLKLGRIYWCN